MSAMALVSCACARSLAACSEVSVIQTTSSGLPSAASSPGEPGDSPPESASASPFFFFLSLSLHKQKKQLVQIWTGSTSAGPDHVCGDWLPACMAATAGMMCPKLQAMALAQPPAAKTTSMRASVNSLLLLFLLLLLVEVVTSCLLQFLLLHAFQPTVCTPQ